MAELVDALDSKSFPCPLQNPKAPNSLCVECFLTAQISTFADSVRALVRFWLLGYRESYSGTRCCYESVTRYF